MNFNLDNDILNILYVNKIITTSALSHILIFKNEEYKINDILVLLKNMHENNKIMIDKNIITLMNQ